MDALLQILFFLIVCISTFSIIASYKKDTKYWREKVQSESAFRNKYFTMLIELFDVTEKTLKEDLYPEQANKVMSKIRNKMNEKFPENSKE